jgi:alpha-N-acetylglucosaminidase
MCARPKFKIDRVSSWSTAIPYFTNKDIVPAWDEMILATEELGASDGFQLDLVDLTRQIISNYAWDIYPKVITAHQTANTKEFDYWSNQFLDLFDDMNALLSTRKEFMVGPWIEMHRNWGANENEKAYFERVAKTFITILGGKSFSEKGLHDYSHREWAGTMNDLYKARFGKYFNELRRCTNKNVEPMIDWYDFDYAWTITPHQYAVTPSCCALDACNMIYEKYRNKIIGVEVFE